MAGAAVAGSYPVAELLVEDGAALDETGEAGAEAGALAGAPRFLGSYPPYGSHFLAGAELSGSEDADDIAAGA